MIVVRVRGARPPDFGAVSGCQIASGTGLQSLYIWHSQASDTTWCGLVVFPCFSLGELGEKASAPGTQREGMFRWIQGSQIVQPSFLQHQAEGRLTGLAAFGQNRLRPRGLRVRVLRVPAPTWKQVELVMRLSLYRVFDGLGHAARRRL